MEAARGDGLKDCSSSAAAHAIANSLVDYLGFTRWRLCVITQFELASTCTSLSQGYCTLQYKAPPDLAPRKTAFRRTVTGGVNNERIVVRAVTNS